MKLRRFISMMLIVTMLTVFAGCGNKDDRTQAAKKLNLSGPITVNVWYNAVSYTHLRAHETDSYLVCRLLLEKKKQ